MLLPRVGFLPGKKTAVKGGVANMVRRAGRYAINLNDLTRLARIRTVNRAFCREA
jgi:hypothetical protein